MTSGSVSTKQQRIAELAARHPEVSFPSLAYHIDVAWLKEAYRRTRKDAAAGVDEVTAEEYEEGLEARLEDLLNRFKSGRYYAPPVKRAYIPKEGKRGEKRPIGIPTLEDKILQRAVVMLLEPMYEEEFRESSYGYRPGRSQHQALEALWKSIMDMGGETVVLEIDIRKFFDTLKHRHLREALKRRVCDGVVIRTIGKWLNAGVMEAGEIHYPEEGCSQGGVISPLLSNVYLHEVLDRWLEEEIAPLLAGRVRLIRYADDAVMVFEKPSDARRVLAVLPKRIARYGLELHPEKTRLVGFCRPAAGNKKNRPETFGFLGFTHYWGKSRRGNYVVKRKTMKQRLKRSVRKVYQWCKAHRHDAVREQWRKLRQKVQGHYQYYGITCNYRSLRQFYEAVLYAWRKWLNRRSNDAGMTCEKFELLLARYPLPTPRIIHSYV
jgi:RNA-directed DNA polymerase